ncbi:MAG: hypothetical protein IKL06_08470 [Lachnospiraceae bacterium]|nr:hypothetical protein [Lachnospiraceae bacterium]
MGELLLCKRPMAEIPYYIEALSLNIYSLEELCYVIEHHTYLMEEHFFSEELLVWVEEQIGDAVLAEGLRQTLKKEAGITKLVEQVLNATGYLNYSTGLAVVSQIREMQHKPVYERRKMRADRFVEHKKYVRALGEYRRLVQMDEVCRNNPVMCGNIWHNQGVIFARLFLFEEACACFEMAYKYHMNVESVYEAILSCRYLGDEKKAQMLAKKYGISEQEMQTLDEKWENAKDTDTVEADAEVMQELMEWKRAYQKNCK